MTPERWRRIEELYHTALKCDPADRLHFIAMACEGDDLLQRELASLLEHDQGAGRFLESLPGEMVAGILSQDRTEAVAEWLGRRLGPYRIERELGYGGMGRVYLAERADGQYRKQVAIKVVKADVAADDLLRRFRNERQVLAALDHPNIARLLDGGATGEGLPYLVMEYIEGTRIDEWCERRSLALSDRLRLFQQVCAAVEYAHGLHVIHRDLKPGNVLVTSSGTPKLLDFGIAKVLNPELSGDGGEATIGVGPMTPEYASPEQARSEPIGIASDIYSLGLVLFHLLTGQQPYSVPRGDPGGVARAISQQDPIKPSTLNPKIPKDLDDIVLKALRKEPEQRYSSAAAFSADIDRLLNDRPVQASRNTPVYRGLKFLKRNRRWLTAVTLGALLLTPVIGIQRWYSREHRPLLTERDSIVLADFINKTGESVFDDPLRLALSRKLLESPFLKIVPDDQMNRTLRMMKRANQPVTLELAREICIRNGLKAVVSGSIAALGNRYVLELNAQNCATGESLVRTGAEVVGKNRVLPALGKAAVQLRGKLGESLSSIQKFDKPMEATTSSLEALRTYTLALKARRQGSVKDTITLLRRAIELDPDLALAYGQLSVEYANLWEPEKAAEYGQKAFDLRDKVTEREKLNLTDRYYGAVTGQLEERIEADRLWTLTYPGDYTGFAQLSAAYSNAGQTAKALNAAQEALRLNPDAVSPYVNAMGYYAVLGRFDDAKRMYDEARKRKIAPRHLPVFYYDIAFLQRDAGEMAKAVQEAMQKDGAEYEILLEQGLVQAYYGRLREAGQFLQKATESARREMDKSRTALSYSTRAHVAALLGANDSARENARRALKLTHDRDVLALAGWSLALAGEIRPAREVEMEMDKRFPLNTLVQRVYLPTLRAILENGRNLTPAIEGLEAAAPYELASLGGTMGMYAVYIRGQTYLRAHKGELAAVEFQKIVDHPGVYMNSPVGPLARLGLAEAYVMMGDTARSRLEYMEFFELWKDADPDLPILLKARKQYRS